MNRLLVTAMVFMCFFSSCGEIKGVARNGNDGGQTVWTEPIRLATYNIQYDNNGDPDGEWDNRKDILRKLLLQYDFDIFGAQEPYKEQIEDIASWLPDYAWTGVSVTGAVDVERRHFNPIFYKKDRFEIVEQGAFWYSETPDIAGSKSWDSYSSRMCNWVHFRDLKTGKEFVHFNSHFDHKGTVAREESAKLLVEKVKEIAGDLPAVCTADYNSSQTSQAYRIIVTSGILTDSRNVAGHRENDKWPTYNGYKHMSEPPADASRIDHIFITKKDSKVQSWKIINDTYGNRYPSDHNPIVIEWSFAENPAPTASGDPSRFFVRDSLISPGVYYYPEQWPESQWERDFRNMADCGFEFTHFGEFAWAAMEPEEGFFDFGWLDKAVEMAAEQGLKVIMCTPTPTPPAWLTHRHPDVLVVNSSGQRIEHGARQQASWASDVYRKYVRRIVTELAGRYGDNPAVIGWQIDNEPSHYSFSYDYSENAQRSFRRWLENKYGDIDSLNYVWGNTFWSQTYNSFDQIRIPNGKVLPGTPNPHAMLDYKRYTADEAASFINMQADILRGIISPDQWIMTNTMPGHSPVDPARMTSLDFLTYTRYLVNGRYDGYGDQGFRISNPDMLGYNNDYYRNIKGVTGVMEIQPGQVNWGKFNPQPYPGAVRLWMYHIFAGQSRLVCHYRFRQPLKGSEQHHYGTMQTDGVSLSLGGKDIVRFNREVKELRRHYDSDCAMPGEMAAIRTAILVSPDNRWEMEFQPQSDQWDLYKHTLRYYFALKNMGAPVDIVEENVDFMDYPVLVAPAYLMVDDALVERWREYAEAGGHLVLTCRTGEKDRNAALWEDKLAGPIYGLIGAEELYFDHLPKNRQAHVSFDGTEYAWNNWGEVITPAPGTEVWARHTDQFYRGEAAVLHRTIGKGTVTYVGIDSDDGKLEKAVMRKLYSGAGLEPLYDLPEGVLVEWRDGFFVGLNYTSDSQTLPVPPDAEVLVGSRTVPPAGVCIWKAAK